MSVAAARSSDLHPTTQYAVDVVDGRIVTGLPVLWACQRHLDDLEHGEKRAGFYFDEGVADRILTFFATRLRFVEGERSRQPFELEPWQQFILGSIFGWMREDGFRRFLEAWIRVASGNGKSPIAAGVALYCIGWDGHYDLNTGEWCGEMRAQNFTAATKLEQARIILSLAALMAEESPKLDGRRGGRLSVVGGKAINRIIDPETHSYLRALGRDSKTEHGWNPLLVCFDEVHSYGHRGMWDVLAKATVKRKQSLLFGITTAGDGGPLSFGYQQNEHYRRIIDPKSGVKDDRAFVYIAEMLARSKCLKCRGEGKDEEGRECKRCGGRGWLGDDYRDERNWIKANPNLGVSVQVDGLRNLVEKAQIDKKREPSLLVYNFNQDQASGEREIPLEDWDATGELNPVPSAAELKLRPCFGGLDLASNQDLNAFDLYFPICGPWKVAVLLSWFWVAEETVPVRRQADGMDYQPWIDSGAIRVTPGKFTDYEVIYKAIVEEIAPQYSIRAVGADRKFGDKLLPDLEKAGMTVDRIAQSFANLGVPWQLFTRLIGTMKLAHGGQVVMRWCAGNVVTKRDADDIKIPSKEKSAEKIDGVAAALNAIYMAAHTEFEVGPPAKIEHHAIPRQRGPAGVTIHQAFKTAR